LLLHLKDNANAQQHVEQHPPEENEFPHPDPRAALVAVATEVGLICFSCLLNGCVLTLSILSTQDAAGGYTMEHQLQACAKKIKDAVERDGTTALQLEKLGKSMKYLKKAEALLEHLDDVSCIFGAQLIMIYLLLILKLLICFIPPTSLLDLMISCLLF
jgi:hypothetical protein